MRVGNGRRQSGWADGRLAARGKWADGEQRVDSGEGCERTDGGRAGSHGQTGGAWRTDSRVSRRADGRSSNQRASGGCLRGRRLKEYDEKKVTGRMYTTFQSVIAGRLSLVPVCDSWTTFFSSSL